MSTTEFAARYDCQVQFQYLFDGKKKQYYPIISHLRQEGGFIDLSEFQKYPVIHFLESTIYNSTIYIDVARDINFQHCSIGDLSIQISKFRGTLGFDSSSVSIGTLTLSSCPNILAFVECEIINLREAQLNGLTSLHTLALLDVGLDYLDLTAFFEQINMKQVIITDLQESIPLVFDVPSSLNSLRLKHTTLHQFPQFPAGSQLEILFIEEVQFIQFETDMLKSMNNLSQLQALTINKSYIQYLPYLELPNLQELSLDNSISLNSKMLAKLRIQEVEISRL